MNQTKILASTNCGKENKKQKLTNKQTMFGMI